jgi:uncharacterized protein (DUF1778 family)
MTTAKTEQLGLRITPTAKALVQAAAAREHRSVSNMVEHLIFKHCEELGISKEPILKTPTKQTKKGEK